MSSHVPRPFRAGYRDICLFCHKPIRSAGEGTWRHRGRVYRFLKRMRMV